MKYFYVISIIAIASILAVSSAWNDSLTIDEVPHTAAGYSYLAKLEPRLNPEHPFLFKDIAALPLLFLPINQQAFESQSWISGINDQWEFGRQLIFAPGNNAYHIARAARLPLLLFFIISAFIIYTYTSKRYGEKAAYMSLIIFSFSPTILAHSRYVTNDVAAISGVLAACFFFFRFLRNPEKSEIFFAGISLGFALITKFSNTLLIFLFAAIALLYTVTAQYLQKKICM